MPFIFVCCVPLSFRWCELFRPSFVHLGALMTDSLEDVRFAAFETVHAVLSRWKWNIEAVVAEVPNLLHPVMQAMFAVLELPDGECTAQTLRSTATSAQCSVHGWCSCSHACMCAQSTSLWWWRSWTPP